MSIPRFFCPIPISLKQEQLVLPDSVANHASRSLRLRDGDPIILFNGEGGEFNARLVFEQGIAKAQLEQFNPRNCLPKGNLTLAQALPSGDKMDWIIEKNSELGVTDIVPIQADRSILQLDEKRLKKRLDRWQNISTASAEQCGRNIPLKIHAPSRLSHFLKQVASQSSSHLLICHPEAALSLSACLKKHLSATPNLLSICLFIGPEGGWSEPELESMRPYCETVRWGERILRTETAGLVLASQAMALLDW